MSSVQTIYHVGFYALIIRGYCFGDLVKTKWDIVVLCSVLFYFPCVRYRRTSHNALLKV